jgi:hypothetical protein
MASGPGFIARDGSKALFILQERAARLDLGQEDGRSGDAMVVVNKVSAFARGVLGGGKRITSPRWR